MTPRGIYTILGDFNDVTLHGKKNLIDVIKGIDFEMVG